MIVYYFTYNWSIGVVRFLQVQTGYIVLSVFGGAQISIVASPVVEFRVTADLYWSIRECFEMNIISCSCLPRYELTLRLVGSS